MIAKKDVLRYNGSCNNLIKVPPRCDNSRWLGKQKGEFLMQPHSITPTKFCTKCGEAKPLTEFSRNASKRGGRESHCKACRSEYNRAYLASNRERIAETKRAYRVANREHEAERNRVWREANRERTAETRRAWYEANRERKSEYNRVYNAAHRERIAEIKRAWARANPGKEAESSARMRAKYPERAVARRAVSSAVKLGRMPRARDLPCTVCSEPAQEYHHHLGYALEHALDVIPVCRVCHVELDREATAK